MTYIAEPSLLAFRDELRGKQGEDAAPKPNPKSQLGADILDALERVQFKQKTQTKEAAISSGLARRLGGAVTLSGAGGLAGAVGGAGVGSVQGYREAKDQGASTGEAARYALRRGLGGATKGGLLGAAAGGALGAAAPGASEAFLNSKLYKKNTMGLASASRAGQRQIHGFTDWTPHGLDRKEGLKAMRLGSSESQQALTGAETRLKDELAAVHMGQKPAGKDLTRALAEQKRLDSAYKANARAEDMGLTSLPGVYRSVRKNGFGTTVRAGTDAAWNGSTLGQKALLGGGLAMGAHDVYASTKTDDPAERGKRVGSAAGNLVGMAALSPMLPMLPGMAAGGALQAVGAGIGKGVGKVQGHVAARRMARAQQHQPVGDAVAPNEYTQSPAVMGRVE
jgi:hypothetical protein